MSAEPTSGKPPQGPADDGEISEARKQFIEMLAGDFVRRNEPAMRELGK